MERRTLGSDQRPVFEPRMGFRNRHLAFAADRVKPRWGLDRNSSQPGVRRVAATPGFVVKPVPG